MARSMYKTIDDEHIMTGFQIGFGEMCSNETCSPCDSYFHGHSLSLLFVEPVYYCYAGSNLPLLLPTISVLPRYVDADEYKRSRWRTALPSLKKVYSIDMYIHANVYTYRCYS